MNQPMMAHHIAFVRGTVVAEITEVELLCTNAVSIGNLWLCNYIFCVLHNYWLLLTANHSVITDDARDKVLLLGT
jgi:hypothetical protein